MTFSSFRHMISNSTPTWVWCLWALLLSLTWRAPPESAPRQTWRRGKSWDLTTAFSEREQAQPPPYQVFGSVCIRHRTPPKLDQGITASRHRSCYSCARRCVWKTSAYVCGRELGWVTVPFNLHWKGDPVHIVLSQEGGIKARKEKAWSHCPTTRWTTWLGNISTISGCWQFLEMLFPVKKGRNVKI